MKYKIDEAIYGDVIIAYHRTGKNNGFKDVESLFQHRYVPGSGATYGKGLYCTYELEDQLSGKMVSSYGSYIMKMAISQSNLLNLDKYIDFNLPKDEDFFTDLEMKIIYDIKTKIISSKKIQDRAIDNLTDVLNFYNFDVLKYTSDIATDLTANKYFSQIYNGIIFTGRNDGRVVVLYNMNQYKPIAYMESPDGKMYEWKKLPINPELKQTYLLQKGKEGHVDYLSPQKIDSKILMLNDISKISVEQVITIFKKFPNNIINNEIVLQLLEKYIDKLSFQELILIISKIDKNNLKLITKAYLISLSFGLKKGKSEFFKYALDKEKVYMKETGESLYNSWLRSYYIQDILNIKDIQKVLSYLKLSFNDYFPYDQQNLFLQFALTEYSRREDSNISDIKYILNNGFKNKFWDFKYLAPSYTTNDRVILSLLFDNIIKDIQRGWQFSEEDIKQLQNFFSEMFIHNEVTYTESYIKSLFDLGVTYFFDSTPESQFIRNKIFTEEFIKNELYDVIYSKAIAELQFKNHDLFDYIIKEFYQKIQSFPHFTPTMGHFPVEKRVLEIIFLLPDFNKKQDFLYESLFKFINTKVYTQHITELNEPLKEDIEEIASYIPSFSWNLFLDNYYKVSLNNEKLLFDIIMHYLPQPERYIISAIKKLAFYSTHINNIIPQLTENQLLLIYKGSISKGYEFYPSFYTTIYNKYKWKLYSLTLYFSLKLAIKVIYDNSSDFSYLNDLMKGNPNPHNIEIEVLLKLFDTVIQNFKQRDNVTLDQYLDFIEKMGLSYEEMSNYFIKWYSTPMVLTNYLNKDHILLRLLLWDYIEIIEKGKDNINNDLKAVHDMLKQGLSIPQSELNEIKSFIKEELLIELFEHFGYFSKEEEHSIEESNDIIYRLL